MENDFHDWLKSAVPGQAQLLLPIGDDAALVDWSQHNQCVVTTDLLADDVHFRLDEVSPLAVGRKCLAVNLSDVAAMAATPIAATVSLLLPRDGSARLARQIIEGMLPLAREFGTVIAGGDTNVWEGRLVVSVTLLAAPHAKGVLRRDGARTGDLLFVSGVLGGSLAGHHLSFQPRVELARRLHTHFTLHAGLDLSDGVATDAGRLAEQSQCGIEIEIDKIPVSQAAKELAAKKPQRTAIERALADGEDFELLLAVPADTALALHSNYRGDVSLTEIGRVIDEPGVWLVDSHGARKACNIRGYEHQ